MGDGRDFIRDYFTSADQVVPVDQLELTLLGEAEIAIRLDIKFQIAVVGLAQVTPF